MGAHSLISLFMHFVEHSTDAYRHVEEADEAAERQGAQGRLDGPLHGQEQHGKSCDKIRH